MKNLFETATVQEVKDRIASLKPDSAAEWGTMSAAQALAHCTGGLEMALGDSKLPRALMGRLIGGIIKPMVLKDEVPMRRNSPTAKALVIHDNRDLPKEKDRLSALIDRFAVGGPAVCTAYPHAFFGKMTPQEWAILMYKHLDHHLRQFSA
jgi:Protein of unknown function (DUF1569)